MSEASANGASGAQSGRDAGWLGQAIGLAARNVGEGGGPFGAILVRDNQLVSQGVNRVTADHDPTAHAEVTAIRLGCKALDTFSLEGCVLYSSCEPCPMCMASALWARIDRVVFGADRDDAAVGGFDDRAFYEYFAGQDPATWPTKVQNLRLDNATEPFNAWLGKADRVAY